MDPAGLLVLDIARPAVWIDTPHPHDGGPDGWDDAVQVLLAVWPELAGGFVARFGAALRARLMTTTPFHWRPPAAK